MPEQNIVSIRDLDLRGQRELRRELKYTLKHYGKEPYDLSSVSSVPSPEPSVHEGDGPAGTKGEGGESSVVTAKRPHNHTISVDDVDLSDRALRKQLKYTLKHWGKDPSRSYSPVSSVITYDLDADIEPDGERELEFEAAAADNEEDREVNDQQTAGDADPPGLDSTNLAVPNSRRLYTARELRMVEVQVWTLEKDKKELEVKVQEQAEQIRLMKSETQSLRDQLKNLKQRQQQHQGNPRVGGSRGGESRPSSSKRQRSNNARSQMRAAAWKSKNNITTGGNATGTATGNSTLPGSSL